jgi:hypothetical protein
MVNPFFMRLPDITLRFRDGSLTTTPLRRRTAVSMKRFGVSVALQPTWIGEPRWLSAPTHYRYRRQVPNRVIKSSIKIKKVTSTGHIPIQYAKRDNRQA